MKQEDDEFMVRSRSKGKSRAKVVKAKSKIVSKQGTSNKGLYKARIREEPIKSMLTRAQHEFRTYIVAANAWPRMKDGQVQKFLVPENCIMNTVDKYAVYKTTAFQKIFQELTMDPTAHNLMVNYVRIHPIRSSDANDISTGL